MKKLNEYSKVAEILGVSQNMVRSWAESGKLPIHRNPVERLSIFPTIRFKAISRSRCSNSAEEIVELMASLVSGEAFLFRVNS